MVSSARSRCRRLLAVSLLVAACDSDEPTGPSASLTGVWRGQTPLGSPLDSIMLILVDSTVGVSAEAAWTFGDETRREMLGHGELTGRRLVLTLESPPPSTSLEFDLVLKGNALTGTMTDVSQARQGPVTLRRALPASSALVGQWVLTAVRGITATPGPEYADTLTLAADGRVRRSLARKSCRSATHGAHDSRGGWLHLELLASPYLTEGQCGYDTTHDSLQVRGSTLTRYTQLHGGKTLEEDFERR